MDRSFQLYLIFLFNVVDGVFYTNVTQTGCIDFDVGLQLTTDTVTIIKDGQSVLQSIYTGADDTLLTFGNFTGRIINYNINRPQGEISFCINNTTKYDGGDYYYERSNEIAITERLYVLDKPTKSKIHIDKSGIVDSEKGQMECKSITTSMPADLNLTYYWIMNETVITSSDKYSFHEPDNSEITIDVVRNDRFNRYKCYASELYGMKSPDSEVVMIDPKHSPIVTLHPNTTRYHVLIHSNFTITCVAAEAYPNVVSFKWYKNNTLISTELNDNYVIENVSRTDTGIYNCTASNGYGTSDSANTSLIVLHGPIIEPMSTIYQEEGRNVNVNCDVQSNPKATDDNVTWTKSGNSTFNRTNLQLKIQHVNRADEGTFICTVRIILEPTGGQSIMRSASSTIQIDVLYGPFIEQMPLISQEVGRPLNVKCEVKSNPMATNGNIKWTKDGNSTFNQTGFNLRIPSLNTADNGSFICTARITLQTTDGPSVMRTASSIVEINVLYGPVIKDMPTISEEEGKEVTLKCDVHSNPTATDNSVTWTKPGNNTFRQNGVQLKIPSVNRIDHGTFICTVEITLQPTNGPSVIRKASKAVHIDVLYGPFIESMHSISQETGRPLNVKCEVKSNPTATNGNITWTKDGNISFSQPGFNLTIPFLHTVDHGYFICTARILLQPTAGPSVMRTASSAVEINVLYPPDVSISTSGDEIYEGHSTNFTCDVSSYPLPNITWTYLPGNIRIPETQRLENSFNNVSSVLEFGMVSCNNTGSYLCLANNSVKSPRNKTKDLKVLCEPHFISNTSNHNYTFGRNESLDLTVWFNAYPEPFYTWSFNGSIIYSQIDVVNISNVTHIYPFKFGTKIEKIAIEESDIGTYYITATNFVGNTTTTLNIDFKREPDMAIIHRCSTTDDAAVIYWKSGWNGGISQKFSVRYKKHTDYGFTNAASDIFEETGKIEYSFPVTSLHPGQVYIFQVQAANDIGNAEPSTINCTVQDTKVIPVLGAIIGGTTGSVLAGVVVVVVILVIRKRRGQVRKKNDSENLTNAAKIESDEVEDGLKDNILYESSGSNLNKQTNVDVYAKVQKSGDKNNIKETVLYADAHKTSLLSKKGSKLTVGENEKRQEKHKTAKQQKDLRDDVYENVSKGLTLSVDQPKKTNKDGLVYADLVFKENGKNRKFTIRGIENRTEYADIDLNLKADPLPSEESDTEQDVSTEVRQ